MHRGIFFAGRLTLAIYNIDATFVTNDVLQFNTFFKTGFFFAYKKKCTK